jgi:hypothetical protein
MAAGDISSAAQQTNAPVSPVLIGKACDSASVAHNFAILALKRLSRQRFAFVLKSYKISDKAQ